MKVAIIGGGHIGSACAIGFSKFQDIEVVVTARTRKTLEALDNIETSLDNRASIKKSDIVILAVKTSQMPPLLDEIGDLLQGRITISLAAQVEPEAIAQYADHLIYAMPNTAARFCNSVTYISNINALKNDIEITEELFSKIGLCIKVDREMLPAGTSVASCGIGYAMKYMAAATEGACRLGFAREEAAKIVCQTVMGACQVVEASGYMPEAEAQKVATPGGLTERGMNAMEEHGFTAAVIAGLEASL